jgi:hypothetical protein
MHHFFHSSTISNIFVEFVMFPSISEIQPRRVSWGDNIILEENYLHQGEVFYYLYHHQIKEATSEGASYQVSIFMSTSESVKMSFCKESNKLVGASNYLAWKKRTDLNLIENEVMEHVKGSITKPRKEDAQALAKYMKGEVRAQRILIESIKDPLIPYVSKLETSKEIYDKLVELFSVSTAGEVISLRQELYKLKISKRRNNSLILYEDI